MTEEDIYKLRIYYRRHLAKTLADLDQQLCKAREENAEDAGIRALIEEREKDIRRAGRA